jgi:hypothetical protein
LQETEPRTAGMITVASMVCEKNFMWRVLAAGCQLSAFSQGEKFKGLSTYFKFIIKANSNS